MKIMIKSLLLLSFFALILIACKKETETPDTITDSRDSKIYKTVKIGEQLWMAENLAYLPSVSPSVQGSITDPYYYVYDYQESSISEVKATSSYETYGVLYNWPAAMNGDASSSTNPSGVQGVCPSGWHLPSNAEWEDLQDYVGGSIAGGKLKETGTVHWEGPNTGATNETGFTALPSGYRTVVGTFDLIGGYGIWWSSTESSTAEVWVRGMAYDDADVSWSKYGKGVALSVRCIRD